MNNLQFGKVSLINNFLTLKCYLKFLGMLNFWQHCLLRILGIMDDPYILDGCSRKIAYFYNSANLFGSIFLPKYYLQSNHPLLLSFLLENILDSLDFIPFLFENCFFFSFVFFFKVIIFFFFLFFGLI